ncbi:MAG: EscU/YscU/HrcU family type III secretion system export apparatus switch protein [Proteobacteria bacterium]|nr:EscU/YscU/HrcU family type III secretion system export apparatus switch protein [Pseudomonadota bacterium]
MSKTDLRNFHASAIKYDRGNTPKLIAQGEGAVAKQIELTARQHNIPILQDFVLSKQLSTIPLGDDIPEALFFALANLFGYILELEERGMEE